MKKLQSLIISFIVVISFSTSVVACPLWSCQYDVNDYSCGCSCDSSYDSSYDSNYDYNCNYTSDYSYNEYDSCSYSYNEYNDYNEYNEYNVYNEYNTYNTYNEYNEYNEYNDCSSYVETYNYDSSCTYNQPQYCQYCGNEAWACTCYNDCYYEDNYSNYSTCSYYYDSTENMDHWANIRDCYGNVIGQVGAGSSVEVIGVDCSDPDRVMIYDYASRTYGSVLSDCVYGGYQWDGTGCNGYYNSYHGSAYNCVSNDYYDANYSYDSCGVTNCSYFNSYDSYDYCDYYDSYDYCDSYDSCDSCGSYNYNCSYGYNYNYCNPNIEYIEIIGIIRHVNSCMSNNVCSSRRSNIVPKC